MIQKQNAMKNNRVTLKKKKKKKKKKRKRVEHRYAAVTLIEQLP